MRLLRERYERGELLGESVFARTYAGRDVSSGREVVIKELGVKGLPDWKPVELLQREAAVLRSLDHPGIPRLVDAFQEEGPDQARMVLVVERVPGETLGALIARGHRWDAAAARRLLEQLLETLVYLHGMSPPVVHRDIKPSNVVVRPDGRPVLVDFGSVRDLAAGGAGGGLTVVGTAGYMPPEQAMGRAVPASDLFSLGATMVHTLTHRHPAELPRDGLELRFRDLVGVPEEFVAVLERMLAPDLRRRYERASQALADLRGEGAALVARPAAPPAGPAVSALPAAPRPVPRGLERKLREAVLSRISSGALGAAVLGTAIVSTVGAPLVGRLVFGTLDFPTYLATLTSLFGLFGAGNMALFAHLKARLRQAWRQGITVEGRVRAITVDGTDLRKARIAYTYEVEEVPYAGTLVTTDAADLHAATVGGPILVVHDATVPRRHVALLALPPDGHAPGAARPTPEAEPAPR